MLLILILQLALCVAYQTTTFAMNCIGGSGGFHLSKTPLVQFLAPQFAFERAVVRGDLKTMDALLTNCGEKIDPTYRSNEPLIRFCERNQPQLLARLLRDQRVDPNAREGAALAYAARDGFGEIVETLIQHSKVPLDLGVQDNYALRWASRNGHRYIVDLLLNTGGDAVDPGAMHQYAIRWAAFNGHLYIVSRLARDVRCDPSINENEVMRLLMDFQVGHDERERRHLQMQLFRDIRVLRSFLTSQMLLALDDDVLLFWMERFLTADALGTRELYNQAIQEAELVLERTLASPDGEQSISATMRPLIPPSYSDTEGYSIADYDMTGPLFQDHRPITPKEENLKNEINTANEGLVVTPLILSVPINTEDRSEDHSDLSRSPAEEDKEDQLNRELPSSFSALEFPRSFRIEHALDMDSVISESPSYQ